MIQRGHYDHPELPDAIAIIGVTNGQLSMHYFDYRGVYRVLAVGLDEGEWRFWRDAPDDFSQRFTGTFSDVRHVRAVWGTYPVPRPPAPRARILSRDRQRPLGR